MKEFIPTTELIRLEYTRIGSRPQREAMFNRWLVKERKRVAALAVKKERDRVSKLLDEDCGHGYGTCWHVKAGDLIDGKSK